MIKKIKECTKAKKDKNFKIIARSDAKGVEGIDKMIDRCKAYVDSGAEIIFPEALADEKQSLHNIHEELQFYFQTGAGRVQYATVCSGRPRREAPATFGRNATTSRHRS